MMRRKARERAVQFLFQADFNACELDVALDLFWRRAGGNLASRRFAEELIRGVLERKELIDERIRSYADHWDLDRMGGVDRNVIRVALYEMFFRPDIPPVVSINEAVDIAKRFGSNESGRFVNGLLDRAKEELCRPAREPAAGPVSAAGLEPGR